MAKIFGLPGDEPGDQRVYDALSNLTIDCVVYSQPKLTLKSETSYPDYVIVSPSLGYIILEVKDWIRILQRNSKKALVYRTRTGREEWETSPVEQARKAAHMLHNILTENPDLRNYAGKLDFSYAYGGVLPHIATSTVTWLEQEWGENSTLGREDLDPDKVTMKISSLYVPFRVILTENQFRSVCAVLDDRLIVHDRNTGVFTGIYDREQEELAKEPVKVKQQKPTQNKKGVQTSFNHEIAPDLESRLGHLQSDMPENAAMLKSAAHVRLLRGFAGTGKTDVLLLRTHYFNQLHHDMDILVTTFNRPLLEKRLMPELKDIRERVDVMTFDSLCSQIYQKKHGQWVKPQSTEGLISKLAEDFPLVDILGQTFVSEEFIWMKETNRIGRDSYVKTIREGRGGPTGRTLGSKVKNELFDIFEAYQAELADLPAHDWQDMRKKVNKYLDSGIVPEKLYDTILIDEAQHFAPIWIQIIHKFLKPGGSLFICDDPSQSVYRFFSWREKGVDVIGRTHWLRIPYRNTREIFQAAFSLIESNPLAQQLLGETGEHIVPDLEHQLMRTGPCPEVRCCPNYSSEKAYVIEKARQLISDGLLPQEIGVLHSKKHILEQYRECLPKGVEFNEIKRQTGLEYKAVFIPQIQQLFDRDIDKSWEEDRARQQITFYMAMTRARNNLFLLYSQKWPNVLEPLREWVAWY